MALRIMIVDDEAIIALQMEEMLRDLGHEIVGVAYSGKEALALIEHAQPDLVFMDISMDTKTDGLEACAAIQRSYKIPVVMVTGQNEQSILAGTLEVHPLCIVNKPYHTAQITSILETLQKGAL